MNPLLETLNETGARLLAFAGPMWWQSSLLILVLFGLDRMLRSRVRPAIRYALWLLVLVKLVLPATLAAPTSPAWWLRATDPMGLAQAPRVSTVAYESGEPPFQTGLAAEDAAPPAAAPLSAPGAILLGTAAVSVGLFGYLLARWIWIARKVRKLGMPHESVTILAAAAAKEIGWNGPVRVLVTDWNVSPAVCGLLRPVILLPRALTESLESGRLRAVLLHELLHLKRGDVWVNFAQSLLQIAYWWHPLLWFANARIRRLREEAVDDAVVVTLRQEAEIYVPTLLEVARLSLQRPLASLGLVGILESRCALKQRLARLALGRAPRRAGLSLFSAIAIAAFGAVAVPMGEAPQKLAPRGNPTPANPPGAAPPPAVTLAQAETRPQPAGAAGLAAPGGDAGLAPTVEAVAPATITVPNQEELLEFAARTNSSGPQLPDGVLKFDSEAKVVTVNAGTPEAHFSYYLTNAAPGVVSITNVTTSCGCTVAKLPASPWNLAAGDTGELPVTINLNGRTNSVMRSVTVLTEQGPRLLLFKVNFRDATAANPPAEHLPTRRFALDVELLARHLEVTAKLATLQRETTPPRAPGVTYAVRTNTSAMLQSALVHFVAQSGIPLAQPEAVFLNDRTGQLYVRATEEKLDRVARLVAPFAAVRPASNQLDSPAPKAAASPQIHIETKFIELKDFDPLKEPADSPLRSLPEAANLAANQPHQPSQFEAELREKLGQSGKLLVTRTGSTRAHRLSATEAQALLRRLQQRADTDVLTSPAVTTLSGRQAQIQVTEVKTIVTGYNTNLTANPPGSASGQINYQIADIPFGCVLDIVPAVDPKSPSQVRLKLAADNSEFLGYDEAGEMLVASAATGGAPLTGKLPRPRVQLRELSSEVTLESGESVLLSGPAQLVVRKHVRRVPVLGDIPLLGRLFRSEQSATIEKRLVVLVKATLLDENGNSPRNSSAPAQSAAR